MRDVQAFANISTIEWIALTIHNEDDPRWFVRRQHLVCDVFQCGSFQLLSAHMTLLIARGINSVAGGKSDQSRKDGLMYVGIGSHTYRLEDKKAEKRNKNAEEEKSVKKKKNEDRKFEDGLLLVVSMRIYGKEVKALIDSGAIRCFVTPSCVIAVGLKGNPQDIFLELGNGEKYLSRGYVPEVPIVTAGLTVKVGLIVTNLMYEVDLVLVINWLQLVNPVVDWGGAKLYVPNAVQTTLL